MKFLSLWYTSSAKYTRHVYNVIFTMAKYYFVIKTE